MLALGKYDLFWQRVACTSLCQRVENQTNRVCRRWLVHSIGAYYGLRTWSVTVGSPARREAYVGVKEKKPKSGYQVQNHVSLPRPLWGMV